MKQWLSHQLRGNFTKLHALMDDCENNVLAFMMCSNAHLQQLYSTNPLEWLNALGTCRSNIVGIFPSNTAIVRRLGAIMM